MTTFRTKTSRIFVDSHLNDDTVRNRDLEDDDDQTFDPKDCVILDGPLKTSNYHQKLGSSRNRCFCHHLPIQHKGFNR